MNGRTRDLGLSSNGKGDCDRTSNVSKFRKNFDAIDWEVVAVDMERRGRKLVKRYGPAARQTIEFFIPDVTNS